MTDLRVDSFIVPFTWKIYKYIRKEEMAVTDSFPVVSLVLIALISRDPVATS